MLSAWIAMAESNARGQELARERRRKERIADNAVRLAARLVAERPDLTESQVSKMAVQMAREIEEHAEGGGA